MRSENGIEITKDYVLGNVHVGLAPHVEDTETITRASEFSGIDRYLFVRVGTSKLFKIKSGLADAMDIKEEDLWLAADLNDTGNVVVKSLRSTVEDILGAGLSDEDSENAADTYIVSTREHCFGASAILHKEEIAKVLGHGDFIMLPSSVHEVLLVKTDDFSNLDSYSEMVRFINCIQVEPVDRLSDIAYKITI